MKVTRASDYAIRSLIHIAKKHLKLPDTPSGLK